MAIDGSEPYSKGPDLVIMADRETGLARGRMAAEAVGQRVALETGISATGSPLQERIGIDVVLLLLEEGLPDHSARLFGQLRDAAAEGRFRSLVVVRLDCLDIAEAQLGDRVELLCEPSDAELVAALGYLLIRRTPALHEPRRDRESPQLLKISEEVGRIARALAELSNGDVGATNGREQLGEASFAYRPAPASVPTLEADRIRQVIRMRRLRDRYFETGLFADPAWDMLLDLMAARLERRDVAVSSLCIAAAVPPTTALRWIKSMTESGLFERCADPEDGRRIFIALSDDAAAAMEAWFAAVRREGGSAAV